MLGFGATVVKLRLGWAASRRFVGDGAPSTENGAGVSNVANLADTNPCLPLKGCPPSQGTPASSSLHSTFPIMV
jgi:hypothetical protein